MDAVSVWKSSRKLQNHSLRQPMWHSRNHSSLNGPTYSVWFRTVQKHSVHYVIRTINQKFLPAVLGGTLSEQEKILFSLPARKGGLGIRDPVKSAETAYSVSKEGTIKVVWAIRVVEELSVQEHREEIAKSHAKFRVEQKEGDHMKLEAALEHLDAGKKRTVSRAVDGGNSNWLTVMPIARHHFDLSSVQFRDALAIRYGRPLLRMPVNCGGCGAAFDLIHALDCKKGGLITQRHSEVRDALGDIAAVTYKEVVR